MWPIAAFFFSCCPLSAGSFAEIWQRREKIGAKIFPRLQFECLPADSLQIWGERPSGGPLSTELISNFLVFTRRRKLGHGVTGIERAVGDPSVESNYLKMERRVPFTLEHVGC